MLSRPNVIGGVVIAAGVVFALAFCFADEISLGMAPGRGAIQLIGIVTGVLTVILGYHGYRELTQKKLWRSLLAVSLLGFVILLILLGYSFDWTGFNEFTPTANQ